jgi:hypothetical protein
MKTMILTAAAALSLGAGAAFAQGVPGGAEYRLPHYAAGAFSNTVVGQNSKTPSDSQARNAQQPAPATTGQSSKTSLGG